GPKGRLVCTVLTLLPPMYLVLQTMVDPLTGTPVPAWRVFWTLFGTANQLLAALTLIGVTVWLLRTGKNWLYTAIPAVFMVTITFSMLGLILYDWARSFSQVRQEGRFDVNGPLTTVLLGLGVLLVIEAILVISRTLRARATMSAPTHAA
ncbi:MAG TPA: carbon starvation CstA 5TM domain-containing protein, partial [Pirellulales bacterium]|nr:carbon starvation CstA 5TM domain-containing protein [Pirellulales bacterium]